MASLRRTKNFANDPQTPMFLYTILKQLDLRSINWNEVADSLGISNGHAARMRYSRMRSQFEGLSNQPKPSKPKKESTGDSKASKSKAKHNKRLLMDDENDRLANNRPAFQLQMPQESDAKRIKVEPHPYMNQWNPPSMYTGYPAQPCAIPYWSQPAIKQEPLPFSSQAIPIQSVSPIPKINSEPGSAAASPEDGFVSTLAIKQEPGLSSHDSDMAVSDLIVVKHEPGTAFEPRATPLAPHMAPITSTYPVSRTISAYFDRQQSALNVEAVQHSSESTAEYFTPQAFPRGIYGSMNAYNTSQTTIPWATPPLGQNAANAMFTNGSNSMMLNPYATTYEDMLSMPLYRRSSSILQISDPRTQQMASQTSSDEAQRMEEEQDFSHQGVVTTASTLEDDAPLMTTTNTENMAPVADSEISVAHSALVVPDPLGERILAAADIIDLESDAETEENADHALVVNRNAEPKIKTEVVEL